MQYEMVRSRRKLLQNTVPETIVHHGGQDMATGRKDMMSGAWLACHNISAPKKMSEQKVGVIYKVSQ